MDLVEFNQQNMKRAKEKENTQFIEKGIEGARMRERKENEKEKYVRKRARIQKVWQKLNSNMTKPYTAQMACAQSTKYSVDPINVP